MPLSASRAHRPVSEGSWSLDRDTAQDRDDARLMPPRASKCEGMGEIRRLRPLRPSSRAPDGEAPRAHLERLYGIDVLP